MDTSQWVSLLLICSLQFRMTFLTHNMFTFLPSSVLPLLFKAPQWVTSDWEQSPFPFPGPPRVCTSCPLPTSPVSSLSPAVPSKSACLQKPHSTPIHISFLAESSAETILFICFLMAFSLFPLKIEAPPWLSCLQLMCRIVSGAWEIVNK